MMVVRGRGGGVIAGRAGAGEHRAWRYDEVEEAQRRLRQREAQLRAPKAERSSEEAGQHLLLLARCGLCARRSMRAARGLLVCWLLESDCLFRHRGFAEINVQQQRRR